MAVNGVNIKIGQTWETYNGVIVKIVEYEPSVAHLERGMPWRGEDMDDEWWCSWYSDRGECFGAMDYSLYKLVESEGGFTMEELGHVVVTKDEHGVIVSVTRQDDEGRVLSVLSESCDLGDLYDKAYNDGYSDGYDVACLDCEGTCD